MFASGHDCNTRAILDRSQMTRTTPELAPPSPTFRTTPAGGQERATGPIHDGSSVESGFESGTLRPRSRHLTTRPLRPLA
ncbi:hypothetical protein AVEN_172244-1 [Araneus ventricosus]|uniref:Uncharacterized protein n=1 Tax=Araneus ventricosus TaxID=182803 RepID=A0A4Y2G1R7_ARAVE|nr:hypothetical protein AVEN_172244-1 [Araneus ventricosus]